MGYEGASTQVTQTALSELSFAQWSWASEFRLPLRNPNISKGLIVSLQSIERNFATATFRSRRRIGDESEEDALLDFANWALGLFLWPVQFWPGRDGILYGAGAAESIYVVFLGYDRAA